MFESTGEQESQQRLCDWEWNKSEKDSLNNLSLGLRRMKSDGLTDPMLMEANVNIYKPPVSKTPSPVKQGRRDNDTNLNLAR